MGLDGMSITLIVLGILAVLVLFAGAKTVPSGYPRRSDVTAILAWRVAVLLSGQNPDRARVLKRLAHL